MGVKSRVTPHLTLVGIDEAGYGPLLGPLCVAMSVVRVPMVVAASGQPSIPNLWQLLERGVCDAPGRGGKPDPRGRIAIADSKKLKLASSVRTTHPLVHLERGVLCALGAMGETTQLPATDHELFTRLAASLPQEAWYAATSADEHRGLPIANDAGLLAIGASQLRRALLEARAEFVDVRCRMVGEAEFNQLATAHGKAGTTGAALRQFLAHAWHQWGACTQAPHASLGIVCDRQGGRAAYGEFLASCLPGAEITTIEESATRSRYIAQGEGADGVLRRAGISFLVEAESHHLPVALASMTAKLCRELAMLRFNGAWTRIAEARGVRELKPTAGYALDARRWLSDMHHALSREERAALVRVR